MRCAVLALLAAFTAVATVSAHSPPEAERSYRNSWAVEVDGGLRSADALARAYGFVNRGPVGILKNVFRFDMPEQAYRKQGKKMNAPYHHVTDLLNSEKSVRFVEQQEVRRMVKKSYAAPTDPNWSQQWCLYNVGQTGTIQRVGQARADINVVPAWIQGVTGCNVIVGVVDDGVEFTHTDLDGNYVNDLDLDATGDSNSAFPGVVAGKREAHGTSCAGIIAMEKSNNKCGVGVAYQSSITGIRLDIAIQTDMAEATALGHRDDVIDVYSNSWGPEDYGYVVSGPNTLAARTLAAGTQEGRGGKGSIFVWAAGNGGQEHDSCAADGYVQSIYTIAIGSAASDGSPAYYDEMCSAKMAVTFVNNPSSDSLHVSTTDVTNECTDNFDGTSAATPVASGAIALALEANPDLTWRDVQYLIAYTSNPDVLTGDDWVTNGAGLRVSHHFGFGAIDAEAMVTRARHWVTVPTQTINTQMIKGSRTVASSSVLTIKNTYNGSISFLEHVVVNVTLAFQGVDTDNFTSREYFYYYFKDNLDYYDSVFPNRGDIQVNLTSPASTQSRLLPYRSRDSWPGNYTHWPFMSVHFWGEDPSGEWSLQITHRGANGTLIVSDLEFSFYGTTQTPAVIARIPSRCDSVCARGCAAPGPQFCDSCRNTRIAETRECVEQCPAAYTTTNGYCFNSSLPEPECVRDIETGSSASHARFSVAVVSLLITLVLVIVFTV